MSLHTGEPAYSHIVHKKQNSLKTILLALCLCALSFAGYNYYILARAHGDLETNYATLQGESNDLGQKLAASDKLNDDLKTLLQLRVQEKDAYGQQVQQLSSTVSTLDKLVSTDKQLLEKYSSIYFLNENYVPASLTNIDSTYVYSTGKTLQILTGIQQHFTDLMNAAKNTSAPLLVLSAYRSFGTQGALKTGYKVTYGVGTANSFSADQGYSEHQLGTTLDFTTQTIGGALTGFDKTAQYTWLINNAYLYGFALSYPKGNTHFVFEPWHWRYVGLELAKKLHDENKTLYDLEQRDIDTYLVKFFD